jgi:hypothetical protein
MAASSGGWRVRTPGTEARPVSRQPSPPGGITMQRLREEVAQLQQRVRALELEQRGGGNGGIDGSAAQGAQRLQSPTASNAGQPGSPDHATHGAEAPGAPVAHSAPMAVMGAVATAAAAAGAAAGPVYDRGESADVGQGVDEGAMGWQQQQQQQQQETATTAAAEEEEEEVWVTPAAMGQGAGERSTRGDFVLRQPPSFGSSAPVATATEGGAEGEHECVRKGLCCVCWPT